MAASVRAGAWTWGCEEPKVGSISAVLIDEASLKAGLADVITGQVRTSGGKTNQAVLGRIQKRAGN